MAPSGRGRLAKPLTSLWLKGEDATRKCKGAPSSNLGKGLAGCLKAWILLSKLTPASSHAPGCPIVTIIWTEFK